MPALPDVQTPFKQRAEVRGEPQRGHQALTRQLFDTVGGGHPHRGDVRVTDDVGDLGVDDHPNRGCLQQFHRVRVGPEGGAPVHHRDGAGDRLEQQRPVDRGVPAADDHHVQSGVRGRLRHEVHQTATEVLLPGRQRTRGERADPAGDDHRPGLDV